MAKTNPEQIQAVNPDTNPKTEIKPTNAPKLDDPRPNVMMILVDDMGVSDLKYLPKTKKLLTDRGVYFPNSLSSNPVCCPARAGLVTAQYGHNNGVVGNHGLYGGLQALHTPNDTIGVWLQQAGYSTAYFGKYMQGYTDAKTAPIPAGWDWWDATGKGTYAFTKFQFANNGDPVYYEDDYITTRLRDRSNKIMEDFTAERNESGKPFFIFDSYVAPHGAIGNPEMRDIYGAGPIPEKKYADKFEDEVNPTQFKPSFNVPIEDYPLSNKHGDVKYRDPASMQHHFLRRIQSLASIDDAVEATVAKLKDLGQYDNTVIIFASDNGYLLGEHQKYGKKVIQTESVHVPLIIAGGNFATGETSRRWATTQDISATILDLAEAPANQIIDGKTLVGADGSDNRPRKAVLIENGNDKAKDSSDPMLDYQGLLMGTRYTYSKWNKYGKGEELYDNKKDPYQLVNVAGDPAYKKILELGRNTLAQMRKCKGVGECYSQRTDWPKPKDSRSR